MSFTAASMRLAGLARGGLLDGVSARVYDGSLEYLLRVGPAGAVPGASRLVRARFAEPVRRERTMCVALRWEATGATGGLFPVLDADILLTPDGEYRSKVTLTGSYRPPLGNFGERLDRFLLHTVAAATISALLARVVAVLEGVSAPAAELDIPRQAQPGTRAGPQPFGPAPATERPRA